MKLDSYIKFRLPSKVHAAIAAEAARQGVLVSHLVRDAVHKAVSPKATGKEMH